MKPLDYQGEAQKIAAEHPSLPGHFPGRPVVPGVVLLDCVRAALNEQRPDWQLAGFPVVKFLSPLLPEHAFTVRIQGEPPRLRFEIQGSDEQRLTQGQIEVRV